MWSIPDVGAAVDNPTGFAFIHPLKEAGRRWAQAIVAVITLIAFAGCTGCNAAASREMAAFARDGGLPYSKWLAKVSDQLICLQHVHANAMITGHQANSPTT